MVLGQWILALGALFRRFTTTCVVDMNYEGPCGPHFGLGLVAQVKELFKDHRP